MYKKIIIQLFLLLILLGILISVYLIYFNYQEKIVEQELTSKEKFVAKIDDKTSTLITDLSYSFSDLSENYYELFADYGEIKLFAQKID